MTGGVPNGSSSHSIRGLYVKRFRRGMDARVDEDQTSPALKRWCSHLGKSGQEDGSLEETDDASTREGILCADPAPHSAVARGIALLFCDLTQLGCLSSTLFGRRSAHHHHLAAIAMWPPLLLGRWSPPASTGRRRLLLTSGWGLQEHVGLGRSRAEHHRLGVARASECLELPHLLVLEDTRG